VEDKCKQEGGKGEGKGRMGREKREWGTGKIAPQAQCEVAIAGNGMDSAAHMLQKN